MIIRLIFIVITTLLTNNLLASTYTDTTWQLSLPDFYPILKPITSDELPAYSPPSSEYHTFEPGDQPPVTVWTLFPGANSDVNKATLITCKTTIQFDLQHLVADVCQKENLI
jgi:hypothetical protein